MKVVFLDGAESDLKDLRQYIVTSFGPRAWQGTYQQIKDSVRTIQTFPLAGAVPDELTTLGLLQYRQIISGMNRFIYEIRGDTAYIHIVCDTRRDMRTLLTRRLLRAAL